MEHVSRSLFALTEQFLLYSAVLRVCMLVTTLLQTRGAAGMLNLGNLNLSAIILSTEAIQTTRFIINSEKKNTKQHRQSVAKQQLLIGLDTAIGCIIWTAPDYSRPERQRPFTLEWQQTSHGPLQHAELRARPACHNLDYRSNYEYL